MKIARTIQETRNQVKLWKQQGYSVGLVPTMGYLHEGHQSLVERSVQENDKTVLSIFVNPMQFAPSEDLDSYPRNFEADAALCERCGVDMIFCPSTLEMYPAGFCTYVDMDALTRELCGKSRTSHFRGVCTVVNKLFAIVAPDRAYFGQKDAQQLAIIRRMARDLNTDISIVECPLVREADGLAKSSRNAYLSPEERTAALVLSRAVFAGAALIREGERDAGRVIAHMEALIQSEPLARIDYVDIVDNENIERMPRIQGTALIAVAVYVGTTRLIDNCVCRVE